MNNDITSRMRPGIGRRLRVRPWLIMLCGSILLELIIESLARRNPGRAFAFLWSNPVAFMLNCAIIALTISIALIFRKKMFSLSIVTVMWLALGVADCMVISRRTHSPLTEVDLHIDMDALLMMDKYYPWWQIIGIAMFVAALLAGLIIYGVKSPRYQRDYGRGLLRFLITAAISALLGLWAIGAGYVYTSLKPSVYDSYVKYGFPYCFAQGFIDKGMTGSQQYSENTVKNLAEKLDILTEEEQETKYTEDVGAIQRLANSLFGDGDTAETADAVETVRKLIPDEDERDVPNIIFVQLESFFDPLSLLSYTIDGDPIPNYRSLGEEYPSGLLYVPVVSGGTVNTEFEVLTGCNLDFMGTGEFPFSTVLRENVCESLATDLKAHGLKATFIHNYTGSFYGRNTVYSNLCFDRFVSIEYMTGYDKTQKDWAKDWVLEKYIVQALDTSSERDFLMVVTAQTHGEYPPLIDTQPAFTVSAAPGESERLSMEYYITQMYETDAFVGSLVNTLSEYPEPVMVVFYGDHQPGLKQEPADLDGIDPYTTSYVIWANFELDGEDADIETYALGARALELVGVDTGVMVKFHQKYADTEDYLSEMRILQYDMLYGNRYIYGGRTLTRTDVMSFGIEPITISSVYTLAGNLFVTGENFTTDSRIYINGSAQSTIFESEGKLIRPGIEYNPGDKIEVCQIAADRSALSRASYTDPQTESKAPDGENEAAGADAQEGSAAGTDTDKTYENADAQTSAE